MGICVNFDLKKEIKHICSKLSMRIIVYPFEISLQLAYSYSSFLVVKLAWEKRRRRRRRKKKQEHTEISNRTRDVKIDEHLRSVYTNNRHICAQNGRSLVSRRTHAH